MPPTCSPHSPPATGSHCAAGCSWPPPRSAAWGWAPPRWRGWPGPAPPGSARLRRNVSGPGLTGAEQPFAQLLRELRCRIELGDRRQLIESLEAEQPQEQLARAVQDGAELRPARLLDQP